VLSFCEFNAESAEKSHKDLRGPETAIRCWRGGELNDEASLKTRNLLKIKKHEKQEGRKIEQNWNITGTWKCIRFFVAWW